MPKTEPDLYMRVVDINRRACHHRGLRSNYGYDSILDVDLEQCCRSLHGRFPPPIRVLDIGCGDGLALAQLAEGLAKDGADPRDFELWGMGLNRYDEMYIPPGRFIESGLNAYRSDGMQFHLVISVFTFHYMWHKLEGLEKIHNQLLADNGMAYLHFPGYLVRSGESYDALNQTEESGNRLFADFLRRLESDGAICPMNYRLIPYTSDDEDCALLAEFGSIFFCKRPGRSIRFGQTLKAFALFTRGFSCGRMNDNPPTYVASHYAPVVPEREFAPTRTPPLPPYRIASIPSTIPRGTFQVDLAIHAQESDRVVVICPGACDSLAGQALDYAPVAEEIIRTGLGAAVRYDDPYDHRGDYAALILESLRQVLAFTLREAHSFCITSDPRLQVMAYSSSAGAVAALAAEYPCIDAILLVAPSFDVPRELILPGLRRFRGDVRVLIGDNDRVVLPQQAFWYYENADSARSREYVEISCCGHDFEQPHNRQLFIRSPLWAFGHTRPEGFPPACTTFSDCC
ncbi:MAG: class I SAM-dependent methyltransferase [Planctomycetes bacterium]|nr:class I SAM-dependent methyltransferase [Planctomycetota bacterium]